MNYKTIVVGDLSVKKLMQKKGSNKFAKTSRSFSESAISTFMEYLTYKCQKERIELKLIDRWFPSSKTCSRCGNVKKELSLKERIYVCECCGFVIDRDYNASINILNYKF